MCDQTIYEEFLKEFKYNDKITRRSYIRTECKNCKKQIEFQNLKTKRHKGYCKNCCNLARKESDPNKALDLIGQKFGHLSVLTRRESTKSGNTRWFCKCSCGNSKICSGNLLKSGKTRSCGCKHGLTPKKYIMSKVKIDPKTGCWIWNTNADKDVYGKCQWMTETWVASRFSYAVLVSPIPKGKYVCHNCPGGDNKLCCNPEHLWLGTNSDNQKDMHEKRRKSLSDFSKE